MFGSIASLVTRRAWFVVCAWLAFAAVLYRFAPPWSSVSRDDDVRFFPPDYPSVIGQGLLERGFPNDTSSSAVVVLTERSDGRLTASDLTFVDQIGQALRNLNRQRPELGIKKVVGRREPVIGERLVVAEPNGPGQVALTVVQLRGTYVSKQARIAVDYVLDLLDLLKSSDRLDLQLIPSKSDPSQLPTEGNNLVVVGNLAKGLHVRVFGANGTRVVDTDESQLPDKAQAIAELKARLDTLGQAPKLSPADKANLIREVRSLVGLPASAPKGLTVAVTGSAAVGHDSNVAGSQSVKATTDATIALVVIILLVVYRSPLLALIPLTTIAFSVWTSLMVIALLAMPPINFQVINITNIFVVVVLFGAGTDYCLFLIARYREELARGLRGADALRRAIQQVGGALVASAGTVILGLGMLWFSTFAKIQYTGPAIALSLVVALVAALTLAPVLLHWLRAAVFWPFRPPEHHEGVDPEVESLEETPMYGFWAAVADRVVKHPALILFTSLAILAPFAWVGAGTNASYDLLGDLGPEQPCIAGTEIFRRYFPEGELGPSTILIRQPSLDFTSKEGREAIAALSRKIAALPGVAEVRSLTRPLGKPDQYAPVSTPQEETAPKPATGGLLGAMGLNRIGRNLQQTIEQAKQRAIQAGIVDHYVSTAARDEADRNHITRIDVIFDASPFSEESLDDLEAVRDVVADATEPDTGRPLADAEVGVAGTTVQIGDLKRVTMNDEHRMYVLVTLGVYAILVILLRRPLICLYLIVTVILGYLSSLGMTELLFRSMHAGPGPWVGLDWKVGFFLFVILVAVGEDYNIFLMARVIEEENKHGPIEGTRRAVAHTGGIISSCGVIMAGTFGSMLFGSLTALRELGFALGLGVLLDTFVVRPILVPAFVVLWHRTFPAKHFEARLPTSFNGDSRERPEAAPTSASSA